MIRRWALVAGIVVLYALSMVLATRLRLATAPVVVGGSGASAPTALSLVALYNGHDDAGTTYHLGLATSDDSGLTWTREPTNPVLSPGASGQWDDEHVVQPSLVWDGSQWVVFYAGHDGTRWRIGRATSPDAVTWTREATNPVITQGAGGAFDDDGMNWPTVLYDADLSPAWHMWYAGWKSGGSITGGYATSSDGITWTKDGQMLTLGGSGEFDDIEILPSAIIKVGATYRLYYGGRSGAVEPFYATGYATAADPAGPWTKQGVLADLEGIMALAGTGDWESWMLRSILRAPDLTYRAFGTAFHPTAGTFQEISWGATSADGLAFPDLEGPLLPLVGGTWDDYSAENLTVVVAP